MEIAEAQLRNGGTIRYFPKKKLGEGTEKEFFAAEDDGQVIGFYKDQGETRDPERLRRLVQIVEKFNPTLDPDTGEFWKRHFCWPSAIIAKPKLGILTPKFPAQYYFSDAKGEKKSKWFSNEKLIPKLPETEKGSLSDRIRMCGHLARAVGRMHAAGLAHSDLSGNNILMNPSNGTCMLIDIDALVVKGIFPSKVLGTRGYIAPEVVKTSLLPLKHPGKQLPNIRTDLHSLAVIIYQTLLLRHPLEGKKVHSDDPETDDLLMFGENALFVENPQDTSNRPDHLKISFHVLGHHLSVLFERAFTVGLTSPDMRPTAYEWEKALTLTTDMLYPCRGENCWRRWFVCRKGHEARCPFRGWKPEQSVLLAHLFRKSEAGQYRYENHYLTLYDNKKLYEWHTRADIPYSPEISGHDAMGTIFFEGEKQMFRNESERKMICSEWEHIRPGEVAELRDGKTILTDSHPKGKLARIGTTVSP